MPHFKRKHVDAGRIPGLDKLLYGWIKAQTAYIEAMDYDDCPWWYNEIAVTGFLAAAAWRLKGVGLQEYRTPKGRLKKDRWMGRCDLYTQIGEDAFVFEAKHYRTRIGSRIDRSLQRIGDQLGRATHDAKQHSHRDGTRLGICFVAPFIPLKLLPDLDRIVRGWCGNIVGIKHSAIAWHFPKGLEKLRGPGRCVFPGVVALIRQA